MSCPSFVWAAPVTFLILCQAWACGAGPYLRHTHTPLTWALKGGCKAGIADAPGVAGPIAQKGEQRRPTDT